MKKPKPKKHPKSPDAHETRAPARKKIPKIPDASHAPARMASPPPVRRRVIDVSAARPPEWPDPVGDLVALVDRRADIRGMIESGMPFDTAVKIVNQRDAPKAANPAPPSSGEATVPLVADIADGESITLLVGNGKRRTFNIRGPARWSVIRKLAYATNPDGWVKLDASWRARFRKDPTSPEAYSFAARVEAEGSRRKGTGRFRLKRPHK